MPRTRTKIERADDMAKMVALRQRGMTQTEIAARLGLTQSQVCRDLKEAEKAMRDAANEDLKLLYRQKLVEIRDLKKAHWMAWERSQADREIRSSKKIEAENNAGKRGNQRSGATERREAAVRVEGSAGDPRFLTGVLACLRAECELLGLTKDGADELSRSDANKPIRFIEIVHQPPPLGGSTEQLAHESGRGLQIEATCQQQSCQEHPAK